MNKLVRSESVLKTPTVPVTEETMPEALRIAEELLDALDEYGGVGLAANQLHYDLSVCVVRVKSPVVLINPRIIEVATANWENTADPDNLPRDIPNLSANEFITPFVEQCLSFPNKTVTTLRYTNIVIVADNHEGLLEFGPDDPDNYYNDPFMDSGLIESIVAQHEIDHLRGITMFDRAFRQRPAEVKKIGRNRKVRVKNVADDNAPEQITKYKFVRGEIENGTLELLEVL